MIITNKRAKDLAKQIQIIVKNILPENTEIISDYYAISSGSIGGDLECRSDINVQTKLNNIRDNTVLCVKLKELHKFAKPYQRLYLSFEKENEPIIRILEPSELCLF